MGQTLGRLGGPGAPTQGGPGPGRAAADLGTLRVVAAWAILRLRTHARTVAPATTLTTESSIRDIDITRVGRWTDYRGRPVDLTDEALAHITSSHPEFSEPLTRIEGALTEPERVMRDAKI